MTRDAAGEPLALETSIVRYAVAGHSRAKELPLTVDLVGAVHIGDKSYYDELNRRFRDYDAVLYELVAPEGTRVPLGGRPAGTESPLSMIQGMAKSVLGLQSQLDHVDYTRANLVHADMSPQEMLAAMKDRGETPMTLVLAALSQSMQQANLRQQQLAAAGQEASDSAALDPLALLTDPQAGRKLKCMMAEQFAAMDSPASALGPKVNQALIGDRNAVAMKVLGHQISRKRRRIAIFYGAAHMGDFERRLAQDHGLRPQQSMWLKAWDLSPQPGGGGQPPLQMLMKLFEG